MKIIIAGDGKQIFTMRDVYSLSLMVNPEKQAAREIERLARNGVTVQLIEQDEDRCVELSDKLPKELCCNNIVRYVRAMQNTAGAALTLHNIAEGQAEALEVVVDEKTRYIGTPLRDMKTKANVLIVCISHGSKTEIPNFLDALFEIVSGFTTTGASVLSNVEGLSKGILYWRSFSHWLGGMGVLVFLLAVGERGDKGSGFTLHLLRAESPGPTCNFGIFSWFSKLILIFDMLAGRLEIFPMLILVNRSTWRRR